MYDKKAAMSNKIDLQIQSNVSDGKYSPAELVRRAKSLGLETIAITDHDTVDGILEAWEEGKNQRIKVIPGIEMSCRFMEHGIHILGFGIDRRNPALVSRLKEFQEERKKKTERIVELLQKAGFKITFEDVQKEATGSTMARPHIALALLHNPENKEKLGSLNTVHKVIEEWLVTGKPTYVDRKEIETKEAIKLIHNAGGVAIWSHPTVSIRNNFQKTEEVLKAFISYDIDGLEAFHPDYSEDETEFLNTLTGQYGLLRSAGSDFHREPGPGETTEGGDTLASFETYGFDISDIISKLESAILKRQLKSEMQT
ncbi:MAG: hypothetical protein A3G49_02975 [Candidatus Sungbacteria bacterium RIFCSPLOWO2_12_FULL_41_11]|uniref:Polymerase/histidinol phosphatase N-terminal domain-containing protein n=1 Tax=Candidatus Sungbacteria bacterium RIFCSPLOWO2_12_FULL_41_11 TaxID=1802286 RepID=A0A1G2LRA7_9BACT|nr:MAG: PHP domain protein [Parcubacteria group bacterium GW2011_GWA2_42_14]OGZ98845.1 MAG: hypothetical protein A3D41_02295 [Candidatus Sungbacteria bacterium RIFCSPHIGHO2_02_FULL_41_12b]OHA14178.1 MAG: hypothetical protein A3G49_02975 [Candidatus Sungbacteria bacterium RIFCSPLOWO2_12_FULL_41_11]